MTYVYSKHSMGIATEIKASSCRMMRLLDSENQPQSSLVTVTGVAFGFDAESRAHLRLV